MDDVKETRGYWNLKDEAVDRTEWGTRFVGSYGPVVRQTSECIIQFLVSWNHLPKFLPNHQTADNDKEKSCSEILE